MLSFTLKNYMQTAQKHSGLGPENYRLDVNKPTFCFDDEIDWQMSRWEKYALSEIARSLRPSVSIEVGSYRGGSLSILSKYSSKTYSIDIDSNVKSKLQGYLDNVEFLCGNSIELLPNAIGNLSTTGNNLILIDGDHSSSVVSAEIEQILEIESKSDVLLLAHDSFNPECRAGMLSVDWHRNKRVAFVDIDFVPGAFHKEAFDNALPNSMWGGFACAVLLAENRTEDLIVRESQKHMFDAVRHMAYR